MDVKECYFDFGQLHIIRKNKVEVFVKNGNRELHTGDIIGGRRITKIVVGDLDAMDTLPIGARGKITLDGMPLLTISGPYDNDEFS
jgi:hypothetical protein